MGRLINLKEENVILKDGQEIGGITEYSISRGRGSVGVDFSIMLPKIENEIEAGDEITFKDITGIVTSKEFRASENGFVTVINGVSNVGVLLRKSPGKTLMYMSMTPDEKEEFEIACEGDYSTLDYVPLIRICDPKTFTGGWTSGEVIDDLARRAGFDVVCNVYSYQLRQVQASSSSSYFDTILSLVSFLKPIVYEHDGVLYILDRPLIGGSLDVDMGKVSMLSQRYVYSPDSKAKYVKVTGGYGKWIREKSKIAAEAERETTIVSEVYQEKPMLVTVNLRGEKEVIDKNTGSRSYEFGGGSSPVVGTYSFWAEKPLRERHTITETWRLDPYGNFKALLTRRKEAYSITIGGKLLDEVEENTYDCLTEEFERPRLLRKKITTGKWRWIVTEGLVRSRSYSQKTSETERNWVYSDNGTLLQEVETVEMDCVKLKIGNEWVPIDAADKFYREAGSDETVDIERMVVQETVCTYRQISPDLYEKAVQMRKLGPLARQKGQENYVTTNEIIRGRIPRHPKVYRKMIVEYSNLPDDESAIEVPVITYSNPNIIDWDDAREIANKLLQLAAEENLVERVISIPYDMDVEVGMVMNLPDIFVGKKMERPSSGSRLESEGQTVPSITPSNYSYIVAYQKRKMAGQPRVETVVTVEAK